MRTITFRTLSLLWCAIFAAVCLGCSSRRPPVTEMASNASTPILQANTLVRALIGTTKTENIVASGSGVFVALGGVREITPHHLDFSTYVVMTTQHTIRDAKEVRVCSPVFTSQDSCRVPVRIIPNHLQEPIDSVVLIVKRDPNDDIPFVPAIARSTPKPGDELYVVGNGGRIFTVKPASFLMNDMLSLHPVTGEVFRKNEAAIECDACEAGDSGGGVYSRDRQLLGIMRTLSKPDPHGVRVGTFVKINDALECCTEVGELK